MARVRLDNAQWDFGTNCFVCEPQNEHGLGIPFFVDAEAGIVVADFTPQEYQSGAPSLAHGGLLMALADEAMSWAVIALAHRFGTSRKMEFSFRRPVRVGVEHSITARILSRIGRDLIAVAEITDAQGGICTTAKGTFTVLTPAEAQAAIGQASEKTSEYTEA